MQPRAWLTLRFPGFSSIMGQVLCVRAGLVPFHLHSSLPANIDLQPGMQRAILLSFYYRLLQANIGHPMMLRCGEWGVIMRVF